MYHTMQLWLRPIAFYGYNSFKKARYAVWRHRLNDQGILLTQWSRAEDPLPLYARSDDRAVARLRQTRRPPPLILGQERNNSRMQENIVAVRILMIDQQISPPPFLRSGYNPERPPHH